MSLHVLSGRRGHASCCVQLTSHAGTSHGIDLHSPIGSRRSLTPSGAYVVGDSPSASQPTEPMEEAHRPGPGPPSALPAADPPRPGRGYQELGRRPAKRGARGAVQEQRGTCPTRGRNQQDARRAVDTARPRARPAPARAGRLAGDRGDAAAGPRAGQDIHASIRAILAETPLGDSPARELATGSR